MNDWQIGMQIIQPQKPMVVGPFKAPKVAEPKPAPLTDSDAAIELETMIRLAAEGLNLRDIGYEIGRSKAYVHKHLSASGQYTSPRSLSRRSMVADMLRRGRWSCGQVCKELSVSKRYAMQVFNATPGVQMVKVGVTPYYWIEP